jgi:serine protease Do
MLALFVASAATVIAVQNRDQRSVQAAIPATATQTPAVPPPKLDNPRVQQATNVAKQLSVVFHAVAESVLPAVVTIEHVPKLAMDESELQEQDAAQPQSPFGDRNPFEGTPFEDFFRNRPFGKDFRFEMPPSVPRGFGGRSMGSGVIIDGSGVILTNNHVVAGGGDVTVRLNDGREFNAVDVKTDPKSDLAVARSRRAWKAAW